MTWGLGQNDGIYLTSNDVPVLLNVDDVRLLLQDRVSEQSIKRPLTCSQRRDNPIENLNRAVRDREKVDFTRPLICTGSRAQEVAVPSRVLNIVPKCERNNDNRKSW